MVKKLTALLETRKIMALGTITLFWILAAMGRLEVAFVQSVIISVASFYFGKTSGINEKGDFK